MRVNSCWVVVIAMTCLTACNGKQAQKSEPVEVEEEELAILSAAPDAPSLPLVHSLKAQKSCVKKHSDKPVNMKDSLKVDPAKGSIVQKKYKGSMTSPDSLDVDYELTIYYQQDDEAGDGVFELDAYYVPEDSSTVGEKLSSEKKKAVVTGKCTVKYGSADDANAFVYELTPNGGEPVIYFLVEGDDLILMNDMLQKAADKLDYTLTLVS